jgi:hypothetical protein
MPSRHGILDVCSPVNLYYPQNRDLRSWWCAVPASGWLGTLRFRDLRRRWHGTLHGATWGGAKGCGYGAISLDGSGYVSAGSATDSLDLSRSFTLLSTVWLSTTSGTQGIMSHGNAGWYLRLNGGKLNFLKSQVADIASSNTTPPAGAYFMAGVTLDPSGNGKFYLNGVPDGTFTTALTFDATQGVSLGADADGGSEKLSGYINDLSVRAAWYSDDEMAELYYQWRRRHPDSLNWIKPTFWSIPPAGTTFTGVIACTIGGATAAAVATFTKPTYSGSAVCTAGHATTSISGTFAKPTYSAAVACTAGPATAAGTATFAKPVYSGAVAATVGHATTQGTAVFANAVFSGSAAVTVGHATAAAVGTFTKPTYAGVGVASIGHATAAALATFAKPVYTGTGATAVGHATAAVVATFAKPTYSGSAAVTVGHATASGTARFSLTPGGSLLLWRRRYLCCTR